MCEICQQNPCNPRCPNAPEPAPITHCALCGEPIYPGDTYYVIAEDICEDCVLGSRKTAEY
jgi:predicted nucleic acid-binding Zn ribbon protein